MQFLFSLPLLAWSLLCGLGVSGSPTPGEGGVARRLTNGQRLARGLPPNPPVRRTGSATPRPSPSASAVPLTKYNARIEARTADGKTVATLGRVDNGVYRFGVNDQSTAKVTFSVPTWSNSASNIRLADENAGASENILGLVAGDDMNIGPGSSSYLQFAALKTGTPPSSTPQFVPNSYWDFTKKPQAAESDIWSVDLKTSPPTLIPQWINTGGSKPSTYIFVNNDNFIVTGDKQKWAEKYSNGTAVTLSLVWV